MSGDSIRYGLTAIRSLGKNVIRAMTEEREAGGRYRNLKDFMSRLSSKETNKRVLENLIKAGALDSMGASRKQMMMTYPSILDEVNRERKTTAYGQMSLFDFLSDEEKKEYETVYPDVGEYGEDQKLAFEKEVLGIYVSGHPLGRYMDSMKKQITARSSDFEPEEDTGKTAATDGLYYTVGGMVSEITVKLTRQNQNMAFVTLEDLYGSLEIIVFPKSYKEYREILTQDARIYVRGRASVSEESGKLIADLILPMDQVPGNIWIQIEDIDAFAAKEEALDDIIREAPGEDGIVIFSKADKKLKRLPAWKSVKYSNQTLAGLTDLFGRKNVKRVETSIDKIRKKR